jgi:phosphoserine phosphatase
MLTLDEIRLVPKVLPHDHLDGGVRPGTVIELARETGYADLPTQDPEDLMAVLTAGAHRGHLNLFLDAFGHTIGVMQTSDALQRVAAECAEDLAADGVTGGRAEVTHSASGGLAEIGPLGVTKGSSLVEWCTERGISPGDVWAFGDMPNDLPMLTWAGVSFAVANAHPDVVAAATQCCPSNAEDGVAYTLESLLSGISGE